MHRMLIVEDDRDISDCLECFFRSRGFAVASVFSGEEALECVSQGPVDVMLLDVLLPGISGIEVLKRIKQLHPQTRVIMVTGIDHLDLRRLSEKYGAVAYITKPFNFSENTWAPVFA